MNIVDSSGWLEYFADGPNASHFAPAIEKTTQLLVPTLSLYEVFKRILQQREESQALQVIATMQQGQVIELTSSLALDAARIGLAEKLPLADSIMLATARAFGAILWAQDEHFKGIKGVRYVARKRA